MITVCQKNIPPDRVFCGDISVQWVDDPSDGCARVVAITLIREGGQATREEDVQLVIPLEERVIDIFLAMLQASRRQVELSRARRQLVQDGGLL